jgi:hypothetical protein
LVFNNTYGLVAMPKDKRVLVVVCPLTLIWHAHTALLDTSNFCFAYPESTWGVCFMKKKVMLIYVGVTRGWPNILDPIGFSGYFLLSFFFKIISS